MFNGVKSILAKIETVKESGLEQIKLDVEKIKRISIVPVMLEMICRSTGMGFAAVARVTEDHWVACKVQDEISFGLEEGGELQVETTICNEIRQSRQPVIIDDVASDDHYCEHRTPKLYGFRSYISIPIVLSNGEFFGTICAIDPDPAKLSDPKVTGMFMLFAQLIAFHLKTFDIIDESQTDLDNVNAELLRYEHLTYHSLREPVRKLSLFSDILTLTKPDDTLAIRDLAKTIQRLSSELSEKLKMLDQLS